jgi:hypothetical protein
MMPLAAGLVQISPRSRSADDELFPRKEHTHALLADDLAATKLREDLVLDERLQLDPSRQQSQRTTPRPLPAERETARSWSMRA